MKASYQKPAIVAPKEKRKPQTCCLCKNHGLLVLKKDHKNVCNFRDCNCNLCENTKDRQKYSAKEKRKHYPTSKKIMLEAKVEGRQRKEQKCRKCLNHGEIESMRDHKKICPFRDCTCGDCNSTIQRRKYVTTEAKTKRQREKNNECEIKGEEIDVEDLLSPSYSPFTENSMETEYIFPQSNDTGYGSPYSSTQSPPYFPSIASPEELPIFLESFEKPQATFQPQISYISSCTENFDHTQNLLIHSQSYQSLPELGYISL